MTGLIPMRVDGDLSRLPESAKGPRDLVWWGNIGFMLIEGTAFILAAGIYLYLRSRSPAWPPAGDALPTLGWSGIFTLGLIASEAPNLWVLRATRANQVRQVRQGMLLMTVLGILLAVARWFEILQVSTPWHHDAYGSVLWMLLILHTSHIFSELGETAVLTAWLFTHEVGGDQFADVEDSANYWTFIVICWLPIYVLIYWLPRLA